ncbi:Signal recognition particle 9 kDa protein [Capsicum annuum]|nr:Signal recognition particle 9 kDa protein [Capsicum annuum]
MVYITSWDDFVERSVQLFRADPEKTRYVMKYRHSDGKLVLKVTDDKEVFSVLSAVSLYIDEGFGLHNGDGQRERMGEVWSRRVETDRQGDMFCQCLKFKTDQAQDAKKMEKLNNIFFTLMARGSDADISEVGGKEQMEAQALKKGRGRKQ